jgi:two-component system, chemotaxis family, protein-glutamate methylesterase/glutaminase
VKRTGPIKVLIVDDSALVRSILSRVLAEDQEIQVVGGAKDPFEARELIISYRPDVIILDVEMPRMDGITFLKKLMAHYPVPVIMCSGVAASNSRNAIKAIECGAVDVVAKPTTGGRAALQQLGEELAEKIRAAVVAMPAPPPIPASVTSPPTSFQAAGIDPGRYLVAIGASTGGTEAIRRLLDQVPADFPPVAIVQHMPEGFTYSFAGRLNESSKMTITEAVDGDVLTPGKGVLARGNAQMVVQAGGGKIRVAYAGTEPVNRHCPSVDVLFDSVARSIGKQAIGVLLTGMGADGARGLLNMRNAGAITIAQNKESCVVYGMPKVAVDLGAVQYQCPPADVSRTIIQAIRAAARTRASVVGG